MSIRIMNLRGVPEDELEEVIDLLDAEEIPYYSTPDSVFKLTSPGLWVHDAETAERAKAVLKTYQEERARNAQANRQRVSMFDAILQHPVKFFGSILISALIIYLLLAPFIHMK